ncbi:hypothetical protein Tco_0919977 [Tanacetum coccineum]
MSCRQVERSPEDTIVVPLTYHVNGQMLLDIINCEEFDNLHDEVAVAVCQLAVLHFVLLGRQLAHNIPDWWYWLIDDKNETWEIYPWVRQTLLKKLEIELQAEVTLANKLSCELTRVAEQMRIHEIHTAIYTYHTQLEDNKRRFVEKH